MTRDGIASLYLQAAGVTDADERTPEAVSVLVDLSVVGGRGGAAVVRAVAPLVAKVEYPGGSFGEVLTVEKVGPTTYEVAVERLAPLSARTLRAGNGR